MRPTDYTEYTLPDGRRVLLTEREAIQQGFCLACGLQRPTTDARTGLCPDCTTDLRQQGRNAS